VNFFSNAKINNQIHKTSARKGKVYTEPLFEPLEVNFFTDSELLGCTRSRLVCDVEVYPDYFLIAFKSLENRKCLSFNMYEGIALDKPKLRFVLQNFQIVTFNGNKFDIPLIFMALNTEASTLELQNGCDFLIEGAQPKELCKQYNFSIDKVNHIDIIEVAPLSASLKAYSGRMHEPRMQDLPFDPGIVLGTIEKMKQVENYCYNDLNCTISLFEELEEHIEIRKKMSLEYQIDLRSKSDAQIAEYVIASEIKKMTGDVPKRPEIPEGTGFKYKLPNFIRFDSIELQKALSVIEDSFFKIDGSGKPVMPEKLGNLKLKIGSTLYTLGMGGLHSNEKKVSHYADDETMLVDIDVESYYPRIILNLGLFPQHIGEKFLLIYGKIVERRVAAKKSLNKLVANMLKIVINGSFGKLGSRWSKLYAPDLMLQVTLTGQLCLLMLIERLEMSGISVVSGNTDGIVVKTSSKNKAFVEDSVKMWERHTGFKMEYTFYKSTHSRDVNNYIAVGIEGGVKAKGIYSEFGSALGSRLSKNPETLICSDAVKELLSKGTSIEETVKSCRDFKRFVSVRTVKGGAVKDDVYLGKAIRWYYKKDEYGTINIKKSGNKVPKSNGAWPVMDLPSEFPTDIDYDWYINEANDMLVDIGVVNESIESLF